MPNQASVAVYLAALGNIRDDLDAIREYFDAGAYDEVNPDSVNWGHVGRLNHIESMLQEIVSELYPERNEQ